MSHIICTLAVTLVSHSGLASDASGSPSFKLLSGCPERLAMEQGSLFGNSAATPSGQTQGASLDEELVFRLEDKQGNPWVLWC